MVFELKNEKKKIKSYYTDEDIVLLINIYLINRAKSILLTINRYLQIDMFFMLCPRISNNKY